MASGKHPKESDIQKLIMEWINIHKKKCRIGDAWVNKNMGTWDANRGFYRYHKNSRRGVPDIIGYMSDGTFLGIEVKSKTGKVSDLQEEFIEQANENNTLCFVARSVEEVESAILIFLKDNPR